MSNAKRMNLREKYQRLTRDLGWEPSYQDKSAIYPQAEFEGIKIHDWSKWEDPFRLTMDAYWKYQAEKERKLYSIIDAFAQNNGQLNVTDARYINALKLFLTGVSPLEYAAHRGFAMAGRQFPGVGAQVACQMQSIDELRHVQTQIHTIAQYNKYFNGFHDWQHMHDRVWYLSVPKSFFDDAMSAGPFEFVTAISFSFEYVLTNLLFMPFMSGAAYNGDMATVTFGFSAQSDESRHMTLGLEVIKFMLEQDPDNVPIVQKWIDKWFWRGYRLLSLVSMMMDYMLPKRVMSWQEAWEMYFEQNGGALFDDLERYGIRKPKYWEVSVKEKKRLSHEVWSVFYNYGHAAAFHSWLPDESEMAWLSEKYPETFDKYYRPRFEYWAEQHARGNRYYNDSLPQLCQTCQIPMAFTEPDDPTTICYRSSEYQGERYHFCSDGCKDIFDDEPEKYVQAWLPVHQIYQGNCGGASVPEVLEWYHLVHGQDNLDYRDSQDYANWMRWKGLAEEAEETLAKAANE
ncbi:aromatic/alkene/methane monooxygenase hydroxylase/oxygenase subunit alpha [Alkalilimnicola sp. S0819]|uniref:aromatic/alkene/methane monooxygenase hydroxylase/oxygenase subunit alpha n=1 Tax=Alkalilimnicola sp. S0819 TaxID=2613922 RepID=UPI0012618CE4|nr:aromatic/alkene/methane monooxygenase hydroxylase/oxygenase subunit alpha [Alkalilimnicola sp. S0819]KAB7627384.1 YHS domain-containing protein [Alkalilimnicola sp. S0819]MPQ16103.1 YHS domain-containing protein [Alkalilimnicola sp. S0819]